jgi:hypothetical protein
MRRIAGMQIALESRVRGPKWCGSSMRTIIVGGSPRPSRSRRVRRLASCSRGSLAATVSGRSMREKTFAQQNALIRARREMLRKIREENDRVRNGAIIPIDVQEIVTGNSDELVKVP